MKRFLIIMLSVMTSVCCCLSLAACGKKKDNGGNNNNVVPKTESVKIIDREVTVYVGGTYKFEPTGANSFTYVSSNQSIAKVSSEGVLTGIADGIAFVDVSAGSAKVTCKVNVIKAENYIRFNAANHYAVIGGDVTIKAKTILNGKETSDKIEFSCDVTDGIAIAKSGDNQITATVTKAGEYKIIAKSGDLTAECTIKAVSASATMLKSPVSKVEGCATLTWEAVKNAGAYAVSVNGGKEVVVTDTSFDVYEYTADLKYGDKAVFSVKAIVSDDDFEHIDGVSSSIDFAHNYEETVVTEHNCQVAGESDFTCLSCGKTYVEKNRLSDHKYVDGVCVNVIDENGTVCGFEKTAKVSYKYDEHNDCYFVEGLDAGYDSEDLYIRAKYNDGNPAHGEKQVKYMALGAFKNNNVVKRVYLPASMTEFADKDPNFVNANGVSLNNIEGMNGKSSPLKGNVFEGCTNLEFVSMPGVHTLPAVAESIYAHWNFRDCYNLKTIVVPAGFENRGAGFMRWDNTPDNAENSVDVYVLYSGVDKDSNHITGKVNRICDAASYPIGSDVGYGNNTLLTGDVFEYDDNATVNSCFKWKYGENGDVISGGKHDFNGKNICRKCGAMNSLGVAYGYDKDYVIGKDEKGNYIKGAYYVADNRGLALETVEILPTYNDGENGEKPVKFVYHGAFQGNPFIKKVILPESVVSLDGNVFALCENLEYISMPGVKELGWRALDSGVYKGVKDESGNSYGTNNNFLDCYNLETVIAGDGLKVTVGQFTGRGIASYSGTKLTGYKKPESKTVIYVYGKNAVSFDIVGFESETVLTVLKDKNLINQGATTVPTLLSVEQYNAIGGIIKDNLLSGDYYNKGTVKRCGNWEFDGDNVVHSDLEHNYENGNCTVCGAKDPLGLAYVFDEKCAYKDADGIDKKGAYFVASYSGNAETVTVLSSWDDGEHGKKPVVYIGEYAFSGNEALRKVTLPASITELKGGVFLNARNLEYVDLRGVTTLSGNNNFLNCDKLATVIIGDGYQAKDQQFVTQNASLTPVLNLYVYGSTAITLSGNDKLVKNTYYYSETESAGKWHFDDNDVPALW